MLSDIEIANAATLRPIKEVAAETLGITEQHLVPYGHYKAKVDLTYLASLTDRPLGRLVLVTALSPTPPGEGKTTTTVGLTDALHGLGHRTIACLREPSMGPGLRHEGRRGRRRLQPGRADDRHQPALHGRLRGDRRRATTCWQR